jgi:hypothetical protein
MILKSFFNTKLLILISMEANECKFGDFIVSIWFYFTFIHLLARYPLFLHTIKTSFSPFDRLIIVKDSMILLMKSFRQYEIGKWAPVKITCIYYQFTNFERFSSMKLTDVEMYVITSNPEIMIKESYFS